MNSKIYLSIVIPCYNEAENLEHGVLQEVFSYLKRVKFSWEVIISDDGSTDCSRQLVAEQIKTIASARLLENQHGGKPMAILAGIKKARGKYLLFTDMDQSTPVKELDKLLPFLKKYEVVIGSRNQRQNFPWYRKLGSKVFRWIRRALILRRIKDTQCGFKILRTDLARKLFPRLEFFRTSQSVLGWKVTAFDVELLYLAETWGCPIKEVSVNWEDRDRSREKHKSYFRESSEMLKQVFKVKINGLRGVYNRE